jgi:prevent-host-death family protein
MVTVSIHEAKTNLSSLISAVERSGEKVIIQRHGRAIVEINPVSRQSRLKIHSALRKVKILDDPTKPSIEDWENV